MIFRRDLTLYYAVNGQRSGLTILGWLMYKIFRSCESNEHVVNFGRDALWD